jgi:transcription initiation factor IIE alpha subunit
MNLVEAACIKASRKGFHSENHSKIFSAIFRFEGLYLDELTELMELNEKEIKKILDELISKNLIKKTDFKYAIKEPFESANSFLFG